MLCIVCVSDIAALDEHPPRRVFGEAIELRIGNERKESMIARVWVEKWVDKEAGWGEFSPGLSVQGLKQKETLLVIPPGGKTVIWDYMKNRKVFRPIIGDKCRFAVQLVDGTKTMIGGHFEIVAPDAKLQKVK
ncbi:MAG: hypothetical protein ACKV19_15225 [Verrucomicrobiales bacterium]